MVAASKGSSRKTSPGKEHRSDRDSQEHGFNRTETEWERVTKPHRQRFFCVLAALYGDCSGLAFGLFGGSNSSVVSVLVIFCTISKRDDSEWGRFAAGGGAIALVWGGGIAVLVLALCLGVGASLLKTGSIGKVRLGALVVLGVATATDIVLWLTAYAGSGWWL